MRWKSPMKKKHHCNNSHRQNLKCIAINNKYTKAFLKKKSSVKANLDVPLDLEKGKYRYRKPNDQSLCVN